MGAAMTRLFFLRLVGATVLAALAALLITLRPAGAASLKPTVTVTADVVTLGDLFDGAGDLAGTPPRRSPPPPPPASPSTRPCSTA